MLTGYGYAKRDVLQNDALERTKIVSVVTTVIHRDHTVIRYSQKNVKLLISVMTVTQNKKLFCGL